MKEREPRMAQLSEESICPTCRKPSRVKAHGEYKKQRHLFRGRKITVRNVTVRSCGCQEYACIGPMLDLLEAHPRKRVVTFNEKTRTWK